METAAAAGHAPSIAAIETHDAAAPTHHRAIRLWGWFLELNTRRDSNGFAPMSIKDTEIEAWARLGHHEPTWWDVHMLRRIEDAYLSVCADAQAEEDRRRKAEARLPALGGGKRR